MSGKARRGNGEGSVYQDTKGVWHAMLNLGRYKNGKRRFKEFQGKRKADVIARRDVYLREHGDLSLEPGANMSFTDYITRWLENGKRNEQKEATHNRAVSTAKTYIIPMITFATVYKGNIIKNLIMDCQSYTKYRPNETTGGIFVSWRRKEELPTGA